MQSWIIFLVLIDPAWPWLATHVNLAKISSCVECEDFIHELHALSFEGGCLPEVGHL